MSTQEDRLTALEQKVADIELERLYEQRKAADSTPSEQAYDFKQTSHRLTMLLGIASGQEHDIRAMKRDIGVIKEQFGDVNQRLDSIDRHVTSLDVKFDQVLQMLVTLTNKADS